MKPTFVIAVVNLALLAAWLGRFGLYSWPEGH